VKVDRAALKERLLLDFEATVEAVADSIDNARDGFWIDDSEEASRVALDRLRQRVYEAGLQAKVDAAEAASPPSGQRDDRSAAASQGPPGV
jgi:hypothetical protein